MSAIFKWRLVGEEIPPVDQDVLVYSEGKGAHAIGRLVEAAAVTTKSPSSTKFHTKIGAHIFLADGLAPNEITHWRYLDTPDDDEEQEPA